MKLRGVRRRLCSHDNLDRLLKPHISLKALGATEGKKWSWLLRYLEIRLKNDIICYKNKSFYNRPKHQLKVLMVKLSHFVSSFRNEKERLVISFIHTYIYIMDIYFLFYIYIFFNQFNNSFFYSGSKIKSNFFLFL